MCLPSYYNLVSIPICFELQVFSGINIKESIGINVQFQNKFQKIGTLSPEEASFSCYIEYDEEFTLSHTSEAADVSVSGYTVPYLYPFKPPNIFILIFLIMANVKISFIS